MDTITTNVEALEAQPVLQPGDAGYWKVWGARPQHVQAGDIIAWRGRDDAEASAWMEVASVEPSPSGCGIRYTVVGELDRGAWFLGYLANVVIVRPGTHNTLAGG